LDDGTSRDRLRWALEPNSPSATARLKGTAWYLFCALGWEYRRQFFEIPLEYQRHSLYFSVSLLISDAHRWLWVEAEPENNDCNE
jgi:hypothetical protein